MALCTQIHPHGYVSEALMLLLEQSAGLVFAVEGGGGGTLVWGIFLFFETTPTAWKTNKPKANLFKYFKKRCSAGGC